MRRSFSLVSAALTAFSLVMLASVVYAYRVLAAPRPVTAPVVSQVAKPADVAIPVAAVQSTVSPQDAAAAAGKFLGRSDAFSVALADLNGSQAYKVTFSSGDVVYVALTGEVLSSVPAPAPVLNVTSKGGGGHHGGGGHSGGGGGGGGSDEGGGGGDDGGGGGGESEGGG